MTMGKTLTAKNSSGDSDTPAGSRKGAASQKTLEDLLITGLKEIYSAERQLLEALPEVAKACYSEDLQDAIEKHHKQTQRHVERIEKVFKRLNMEWDGKETCPAMEGLILENKRIISEFEESPVRDSALIIGAQKIEHYEIACYGSLCELCDVLGYWNLCDVLGRTLDEEEKTDLELTEIAMRVNDDAYEMSPPFDNRNN
jgi:ferritin-like metal-binding protein YciE